MERVFLDLFAFVPQVRSLEANSYPFYLLGDGC
jgi:hypothetical protein